MLGRTDKEILSHVRRALRDVGEEQFTGMAYQRWRQRELERHDRPIPSFGQLKARYGSFTEALQLAQPNIPRRRLRPAGEERVRASRRAASASARRVGRCEAKTANDHRADAAVGADVAGSDAGANVALVTAMAETLTHGELRELERFLRRRLTKTPRPAARRRVSHLGALADLLASEAVITKPYPVILRKTYDEKRPPSAPSSDTLQRNYGSWVKACRAAGGVNADGRKAGPGQAARPYRPGKAGPSPSYTREEVIAAVHSCAEDLERSLSELSSHDYHQWQIERAARLRTRGQSHRLPNYRQITPLFRADAEKARTTIWAAVVAAAEEEG